MALSKNEFRGTGKVFSFTFRQMLKNRGNLISLIIMVVLAAASVPLMTLFGGGENRQAGSALTKNVYIINDTKLTLDWTELAGLEPYFSETVFEEADFAWEDRGSRLAEGQVLLHVCQDSALTGYRIDAVRVSQERPDDEEINLLLSAAGRLADQAKYKALGISEEQLAMLNSGYQVSVQTAAEYRDAKGSSFETRYWIQFAYAIAVMMLSIMSVSYIIRIVVEEKASKLVELLMVSVRPLALIVGKILASMAFVFGMFALMIGAFFLSYGITGLFLDVSAIAGSLGGLGITKEMFRISPLAAAAIFISLLTGYLTFSIIAGLFGSACSSTSEMEGAMLAPTLIIMAGYIASCSVSGFEGGPAVTVCSLCPVLSVFCAPVQYLLGNIGLGLLLLAWVLQLAVAVLLALFCAKIYNELIIHRGSRVSLRQMIAMARGNGRKR